MSVHDRIAAAIGAETCEQLDRDRVRVQPPSTESCGAILGLCYDEGWRVVIEGQRTWQSDDAPAQVMLSLRAMDRILETSPSDLAITTEAGAAVDALRQQALEQACWLPLDPPGHPGRSIGSVLATGTAGPLRQLFGPVQEEVLAVTVVTGDGRVIRSGAAGATQLTEGDLIRLHVGGFGGFGVITECQLRLHQLPRADATWVAVADRDRLTDAARQLAERQVDCAAAELMSPSLANEPDWLLAVRFTGSRDEVDLAGRRTAEIPQLSWRELTPAEQLRLWSGAARPMSSLPLTFRLGGLIEGLDDTLDLVVARLGESLLSAGAISGVLRWCGEAEPKTLRLLRATLSSREIPFTLERAPWPTLRAIGHFGAYREGGAGPIGRFRERFDPKGVLVAALGSEESE